MVATAPFASVDRTPVVICVFGVQLLVGVIHSVGIPGEAVIVSALLALKPDTLMRKFATVLTGTYVVPESVVAVPVVIATFGVTVNVAVPTFPAASVTVTVCAPTPDLLVVSPAGIVNKNTEVPSSVVAAVEAAEPTNEAVAKCPATFPTVTEAIDEDGPKLDTVAVTTVPTGPEFGDKVTAGVASVKVDVAVLLHESVNVNAEPRTIAGKLTVPVYAPAEEMTLLLRVVAVAVVLLPETVMADPPNDAAVITLVNVVSIVELTTGKLEPETVTEDPAEVEDGVTMTVGFVIVNVPATTLVDASEMITVCPPAERP